MQYSLYSYIICGTLCLRHIFQCSIHLDLLLHVPSHTLYATFSMAHFFPKKTCTDIKESKSNLPLVQFPENVIHYWIVDY